MAIILPNDCGFLPTLRAHGVGVVVPDEPVLAEGDVVGVAVGDVEVGDGLWVGVVVVGVGVGVVVAGAGVLVAGVGVVVLGVGMVVLGVGEAGADGDDRPPWAPPTRLGPCAWWPLPVNMSAIASTATPATATAPPVAIPAANARRSRRYSVRRRSRSQPGNAARRAAQLL